MQKTNHSQHSHITFDEVSKQVHNLRDLILWDIQQGFEKQAEDSEDDNSFTNHLMFTKYWFIRVSSVNKKRFCLVLLEHMPCAWALSLLLKSIWNCRPKDAVASQYEATVWSSYDQVPMDHNRSALPIQTLTEVMETDRIFFGSLEPHRKAEFLSELLRISGGPIVWAVFQKAQTIFDNYREDQLRNILASIEVTETQKASAAKSPPAGDDKSKKEPRRKMSASGDSASPMKQATQEAQKELEVYLAQWTSIINSVKDSQKLEEVELSFSDGTKKRIWKFNRPKPEVTETVDYFQLLPHNVAKRVLNYVPWSQLADCARVNRYWAYLVEEFKAELAARLRIDLEIEKLTDLMLRHDINDQSTMDTFKSVSTTDAFSAPVSQTHRRNFSKHASQKTGRFSVSVKTIQRDTKVKLPPIRNLKQLSERLDRRGAADDNLWDWCKIVLERYNPALPKDKCTLPRVPKHSSKQDGVMDFGNIHFLCPLMSMSLKLPLNPPLTKDPTTVSYLHKKNKQSNINASKINLSKYAKKGSKRYNLWSRDFSSLYTALKLPNYKSPV